MVGWVARRDRELLRVLSETHRISAMGLLAFVEPVMGFAFAPMLTRSAAALPILPTTDYFLDSGSARHRTMPGWHAIPILEQLGVPFVRMQRRQPSVHTWHDGFISPYAWMLTESGGLP